HEKRNYLFMKIGFLTPVVTIFDQDGNLDCQGNLNVYEHLIAGGVDGIVLMGSTGEFFTMSMEQKKQLITLAVPAIKDRTRVLVGVSCMDYRETIELANFAKAAGAEAVMVIPPYYFALSDASIESYLDRVAEGTDANIFIYNFPDRNGYDISPSLTLSLARKHKNIVGYKDTVINMDHTRELIKLLRPEFPAFEIMSGYDDNFVHNVLSGGNGNIGALSNLAPEVTSALCTAVREKNVEEVVRLQRLVDRLMSLYAIGTPFMPYLKKAMMMRGVKIGEYCTVPFLPANPEEVAAMEQILKQTGLIG
ncbi:MAG: dihydrodipicolinate synthase family protein, partial [Pseudoflavonifractor sp.]